MLLRWLGQWGLKRSEKEILSFLLQFTSFLPEEMGHVVGMAALIHCQIAAKNPEFEKLIMSLPGENTGPISALIVEFNRLLKQLARAQRLDEAAALKLWIVTLRCMSSPSFQHHGASLWRNAARSFPAGEVWIRSQIKTEGSRGNSLSVENLTNALARSRFVPPQFAAASEV